MPELTATLAPNMDVDFEDAFFGDGLMVYAEQVVYAAMTEALSSECVCVLIAGLSWVPWLLMHHRCAAPPSAESNQAR